jgi:hypothetical protein
LQPLECRFCHHTRTGLGKKCHSAIEEDWHGKEGQSLVIKWGVMTGAFERQGLILNRRRYNKGNDH